MLDRHVAGLRSSSALQRQQAAQALAALRDPAAVPSLLDQLWQESDKVVRSQIIVALDRIGDQRVVEPLLQMLRSEIDEVRAQQMLAVVIRLAGPSVAEPLLDILATHRSYSIRREIVALLGQIRLTAALYPLLDLLAQLDYQQTYHNQGLRTAVLRALGQLRDARAVPPLLALLAKGTARQFEIIHALGMIGDRAALPTVQHYLLHAPDLITQAAAKSAFINLIDDRDLELLLGWLFYDNLAVRMMALQAVGRLGDGRVVDAVARVLHDPQAPVSPRSDEDTNRRLRLAAIEALVTIGDRRAVPHLARYWLWPMAWGAIWRIWRQG